MMAVSPDSNPAGESALGHVKGGRKVEASSSLRQGQEFKAQFEELVDEALVEDAKMIVGSEASSRICIGQLVVFTPEFVVAENAVDAVEEGADIGRREAEAGAWRVRLHDGTFGGRAGTY
jgi:hypothetical protein